jgi:RNA polymerase sigma factor for flagellar operon FliA
MRGSKSVTKRDWTTDESSSPQLALFGTESPAFEESLKNLSLAADRAATSGEDLSLIPIGPPIAPEGKSGHSIQNRISPTAPKKAQPSIREGGEGRHLAKKVKGNLMARATAAVLAKETPRRETKQEQRDRVVMEHLPLVKAIAVRVHESLPVHVELDDLVHAGILGLFDAATKYDPDKKVVFSAYAKHRIKGAILDSLRQLDWASRDLRRRHKQVEQATRDLCAHLQRQPTEDELAERMGVEVSRWRQMALDLRNVGLVSASSRAQENEDLPAPDFPSKPESQPDSMCAREEMKEKLEVAMAILPERYKKVVVLYYTNEMTMKEIGGMLGINESRVSQIHKSALEKMAVVLQSNGICSSRAF